jgi:hypothetical protein
MGNQLEILLGTQRVIQELPPREILVGIYKECWWNTGWENHDEVTCVLLVVLEIYVSSVGEVC